MTARIKELFPELEVTAEYLVYHGGKYVSGDKDSLVLDDDFDLQELKALVEWMESEMPENQPKSGEGK